MPVRKRKQKAEASQFQRLLEIVETMEPFRTPEGKPHVTVTVGEHFETYAIPSEAFAHHIRELYWSEYESAPSSAALKEAVDHAMALAAFRGPVHPVGLRVAEFEGALYVDLARPTGEAVRLAGGSWEVVERPHARFRRSAVMKAHPIPIRGGDLMNMLHRHFRLAKDEDYVLLAAWIIQALQPHGPYPILVFIGEEGTGKSTATEMVRTIVDPSFIPSSAAPKDERDLAISASNSHVIALNNLSNVRSSLSDQLCRLATGGGFATRRLYTDREQEVFYVHRPVIMNGIDNLTTRADLASRALVLLLDFIPDTARRGTRELWQGFEADLPALLGAVLSVLARAWIEAPRLQFDRLPRMADFARLAVAAEPYLACESGTFLAAYESAMRDRKADTLELDPVADAVEALIERDGIYEGKTMHLFRTLAQGYPAGLVPHDFPRSAQAMTGRLRRIEPALRAAGIHIERWRTGQARGIRIHRETA